MSIELEAEVRVEIGKGASRRLRRLEQKVPGIVYGGDKKATPIYIMANHVAKALETPSIYSSVFDLKLNGKVQQVILKDLQRHPFKPIILHMDLQRVSAKDVLIKMVPLQFVNEKIAKGVSQGGIVNHSMSQVEVRCEARHLPEHIEVDIKDLDLNETIHLSQLNMPKGVKLATEPEGDHDHPVVSIHLSKGNYADEAVSEREGLDSESENNEDETSNSGDEA